MSTSKPFTAQEWRYLASGQRALAAIAEADAARLQASLRRDALLGECQRLRDAGRRREAKRCLAEAEKLQELLTQLEQAVRREP